MSEPVISIERIRREAQDAATRYSDINDACPYPWAWDAAHAFKAEFKAARAAIEQQATTTGASA